MKKIIIMIIIMSFVSCGRWKTTGLKSTPLCSIDPGENPGSINLGYDQEGVLNISFGITIHQGIIYTTDNILRRVQVIDKSCAPILIIGQKSDLQKSAASIKKSYFNFSITGSIAVDSDDNLYVLNRFASSNISAAPAEGEQIGFSPTYILVFDNKGNLLYTLGRRGSPDLPFNFIEDMLIDSKDRLVVIARSFDTWSIYIFKDRKQVFEENFGEVYFRDGNDAFGTIENIKAFKNGENMLLSVAYYENSNFKYRKIINYSVEKHKIDDTVMTITDPQNELFSIADDKLIYLWDVQDNNVTFVVCNLSGNVINNVMIQLPAGRDSFSDIIMDENGDLYSYQVVNRKIDILRWR